SRIDKVLQNTEIQNLITAIGTGVRDEFNLENARYHKIILMTDADVDGAHIRTLALTLLFREMQELIEAGYVYIAKPPLYKLKQGRNERYIEQESELEDVLLSDKWDDIDVNDRNEDALSFEALRGAVMTVAGKGVGIQRFKGLGEMNADQLRETTMDPGTRTLQQVTMDDATAADRLFSMLMGDQVEPRRAFIEDNARAVANLDV